jgi:SSS family solute:Na+ symporter
MSVFDYVVIALYVACIVSIGLWASRGHTAASDLLLGRRSIPSWAVMASMIATELSAATFIGVPHAAYTGSWIFLQLAFGSMLGKLVIASIVIPLYHRTGVVTVYGFLELRLGPRARRTAAAAFAAGRVLASGVRLFIAALAFSVVGGWPISITIIATGAVALAYTRIGGIRAVIWTDTLQGLLFVIAAIAIVVTLCGGTIDGFTEILRWGQESGKTNVFVLEPFFSLSTSRSLGTAIAGGFFLTLATHATDHDMVQRLLTARSGRAGGWALAGSGLLNFPLSLGFLFIGTAIAHFYAITPPDYDISSSDSILPLFALHELAPGIRGLVFAGLLAAAMSSLDSAVCAIATTWVVDIFPTSADDQGGDALAIRLQRVSTGVGAVLIVAALAMAAYHSRLQSGSGGISLVEFALSSMTILYGGLLGVFTRAITSSRPGGDGPAVAGLVFGGAIGFLLFVHPAVFGETLIAWTWWIPISSIVAYLVSAPRLSGLFR